MTHGVPAAARAVLPPALTVLAAVVLLQVVYDPWYLNYDARYALLWASDLWSGFTPEYKADFAPTPRPFQTAVASLLLPFGDAADDLLVLFTLACFGALVWLVYRLGAQLFSPWVGVVAAVVVASRPALHRDAVLAYQDVPFAALIVLAVLLEAQRPRRGVPVLAVLALAGLIRPEAWVLAGAYWLWLMRGQTLNNARGQTLNTAEGSDPLPWRRWVAWAALAAAAPLIWSLTDLLVTGDPLHSLHGTSALAEEAGRRREIGQVPRWTAQYLAFTLREALVIGVPIGLVFAVLHRRREAALLAAVAGLMLAVFAIGPLFGLPLIGRYVRTPAILLAILYGAAVFGWLLLPEGRSRRRWLAAGVVAALLSLVFLPKQVTLLRGLERRVERDTAFYAGLRDVGQATEVRRAFAACGPLSTADHRPIPYVRWWLDGAPGSVGTVASGASPLGRLLLVPRRVGEVRRFYRENFPRVTPPASYRPLYGNRSWRVYAAPECLSGGPPRRGSETARR